MPKADHTPGPKTVGMSENSLIDAEEWAGINTESPQQEGAGLVLELIEEIRRLQTLNAAAPDMLEALKDIIEQAEKANAPVPADLADSIRVFGKKAIAKAENV